MPPEIPVSKWRELMDGTIPNPRWPWLHCGKGTRQDRGIVTVDNKEELVCDLLDHVIQMTLSDV